MKSPNSSQSRRVWMAALLLLCLLVGATVLYWLIRVDAVVYVARLNHWLADTFIARMGYGGVFLLMFIESSLVPFPSEIVVPPAADLARRSADWSLAAVIFWGTAGSLAGGLFNYFLARYLGRRALLAIIHRFGTYVRLSQSGYEQAEALFLRHGAISTFTGRLIPGIRQIISLPAGLARMNLLSFCLLTSLGAGIWVAVLAWIGYHFGADPAALSAGLKANSRWVIGGGLLLAGGYVLYWSARNRRRPSAD